MKKLFLVFLAAMLLLTSVALADVTVEAVQLARSVSLCKATNCYVDRADDGYHLYDANGNMLSAGYKNISVKQNGHYLEVQNISNSVTLNCYGLLDAQGNEILPLEYGDFEIFEPDWVLAYVLGPAEGDLGEYKDSQGNKYIVTRTDVVYKGKVIGSMGRDQYQKSYTTGVRGDYLYVKMDSSHAYWLDSSFNRVDATADYVSTSEYTDTYKKGVLHNATQQYAFTADCTLTPDQVDQAVWYDSTNHQILDLQGNVVASSLNYASVYLRKNYFVVRDNLGLYGIMDLNGNLIVEPKYKEIAYHTSNGLFAQGYTAMIDDKGCLCFVDENGTVTASAEYELSSSDYKGFSYNSPILAVKNMGKYMIITATKGELPGKYEDVLTPYGTNPYIAVQKNGLWGVLDIDGNEIVPFILRSSPSISADGSLIMGTTESREYFLYKVTATENAAPVVEEVPAVPDSWTETKVSGEDMDDTPVLAEGAWECTCGVITNGKFCPECGSKKPEPTPTPEPTPAPAADDGSWACDCGSVNTGKFCPECGNKKPEATPVPTPVPDPQCVSCGYKPEGTVPKFCPECGTKF